MLKDKIDSAVSRKELIYNDWLIQKANIRSKQQSESGRIAIILGISMRKQHRTHYFSSHRNILRDILGS